MVEKGGMGVLLAIKLLIGLQTIVLLMELWVVVGCGGGGGCSKICRKQALKNFIVYLTPSYYVNYKIGCP